MALVKAKLALNPSTIEIEANKVSDVLAYFDRASGGWQATVNGTTQPAGFTLEDGDLVTISEAAKNG